MMRVVMVLVLTLILLLTMAGVTSSRVTPYPESEAPGGDDHPWGGEYSVGDPDENTITYTEFTNYNTGILMVDIIFNAVVLNDKVRTVLYSTSSTTTEDLYTEKGQITTNRRYIGRHSVIKGNR